LPDHSVSAPPCALATLSSVTSFSISATPPPWISPLSLHDALPISDHEAVADRDRPHEVVLRRKRPQDGEHDGEVDEHQGGLAPKRLGNVARDENEHEVFPYAQPARCLRR